MCSECEKSLPNQIVFDKIESIIRMMQDEQNGLPVKTAKSFMSKIPSVFTGTDLIQWMMKNLRLDDQQEAIHLANLIASHGYIFPIEDHTLSIKNDCTFYRFQTPCLWPSNNIDPENTDYAVYLCKRTMQGKARLELADYEAENLARLQKMFSRKWEFIFMQAESQAKVDKKRDKLERKVLDSQERAFWDVYRPVPGCVNTTELDIKKACRLSKSAKRCGECQKVSAGQSGTAPRTAVPSPSPAPADGQSGASSLQGRAQTIEEATAPDAEPADWPQPERPAPSSSALLPEPGREPVAPRPDWGEPEAAPECRTHEHRTEQAADSDGRPSERQRVDPAPEAERPAAGGQRPVHLRHQHSHHHHQAHAHAHAHHHHHHHHHHPHSHQHAHHAHHHHLHHRSCPHHHSRQAPAQLGEPGAKPVGDQSRATRATKKRSVGSVDQIAGPQSAGASRRRSECNRMLSMSEAPLSGAPAPAACPADEQAECRRQRPAVQQADRPASACCSLTSLGRAQQEQTVCIHQLARGSGRTGSQSAGSRASGAPMLRKSSLNILRPSGEQQAEPAEGQPAGAPATSRKGSMHVQAQRSQLKGTQSVCATTTGSSGLQELHNPMSLAERQSINDLERELEALKVRLDRGGVKMSKVTQSYLSYFKQWAEYDPFIAQPIPSNPWQSDSTELWDSERQTKDVHCRRVRRWAFSLKELLNDPAGREQFHRFLEKEFSAENLKFWDAVQELKRVHAKDVAQRVEAIWTEYLAQDANCPINIDSKSYETSKKNMAKNKNNRYIFDEAAGHVYQLMKNDSYPRYLRSDMYKDYKEASERRRPNQVAFDVFKPQITTLKHKFNF